MMQEHSTDWIAFGLICVFLLAITPRWLESNQESSLQNV